MRMEVHLRTLLAKERELWHTWRTTGDKKGKILTYHHSQKQFSLLIMRRFDNVISHIKYWSSIHNLGKSYEALLAVTYEFIVSGLLSLSSFCSCSIGLQSQNWLPQASNEWNVEPDLAPLSL